MLEAIFQNPFNTSSLKKYTEQVNKINSLEKKFQNLSDDELRKQTEFFKNSISKGAACNSFTCEAFAIVREATKRVLNIFWIFLESFQLNVGTSRYVKD